MRMFGHDSAAGFSLFSIKVCCAAKALAFA
jgi:hypothetical protein